MPTPERSTNPVRHVLQTGRKKTRIYAVIRRDVPITAPGARSDGGGCAPIDKRRDREAAIEKPPFGSGNDIVRLRVASGPIAQLVQAPSPCPPEASFMTGFCPYDGGTTMGTQICF